MGKCGGHELNYVSDVDVVFVFEPAELESGERADESAALRAATQLASHLMRVCSDQTREGTIWPVDANLRPEGAHGPLVRTLASHRGYYEKWAKTWEFQALLKARPVAGDLALGQAYIEAIEPMVWSAAERDGFVTDVQAMRRRVIDHIPAHEAERQIKLGSGGLRDVEFAVQLLQLVHGRADPTLRDGATLSALARLISGGYVGREDGEKLHEAYAFLRTLEHRVQLHQLRRTHVLPEDEASLRRLGRSLGHFSEPVVQLDKQWRYHRREVRRLHEKLFYRPLLGAVAKLPGSGARLSLEAAGARLAALGYADPKAALRHLEALTSGRLAHLRHPAHAAAGAAGVVRRRPRPRRRALRLPPDQREPGPDAVVPDDAARRGRGRPATGPRARHVALRHRPAGARAAGREDAGRVARPAQRRGRPRRDAVAGRAPGDARDGGRRGAWPYVVASCCGSPAGSSWRAPTSPSSGRA